jgi:hypothetical protein
LPFIPCVFHIPHVLKFSEPPVNSGGFVFYKSFLKKNRKNFGSIKIITIFTPNFKTNDMLNTNKITKETLKALGQLLRNNKGIKTLDILNNGRKSFEGNKKEFCNEVLNLLESGKLLQISLVTRKGYFGNTQININNYLNDSDIEEINVSVYTEAIKKADPTEWTLD